jgi:hypothetical protein
MTVSIMQSVVISRTHLLLCLNYFYYIRAETVVLCALELSFHDFCVLVRLDQSVIPTGSTFLL